MHLLHEFKAIDTRHAYIGDNGVRQYRLFAFEVSQGNRGRVEGDDLEVGFLQRFLQYPSNRLVIVDNPYTGGC